MTKRVRRLNLILVVVSALLCAFLWSALDGAPAYAETFTVTKTTDTNDGTCDGDCSLREAIGAANQDTAADTIILGSGTYLLTIGGRGEDNNASGDLDIRSDLTIQGSGADTSIIDGSGFPANNTDRVIHIVYGYGSEPFTPTVTIEDVQITGGDISNTTNMVNVCCGGGIRSEGQLTLRNTKITGNYGNIGAGIYQVEIVRDSTAATEPLLIENSLIAGNFARDYGGGVGTGNMADFIIRDSIVEDNVAGFQGGGLYGMGNFEVIRTSVDGNHVQTLEGASPGCGASGGGGIYLFYGLLKITDSEITGNEIQDDAPGCGDTRGGGIYYNGGYNDGSPDGLVLINTQVLSNTANAAGGIWLMSGAQSQIEDSLIAYNHATTTFDEDKETAEGGGAILNGYLSIKNSRIMHNSADGNGGGLVTDFGLRDPALIEDSLIADNQAGGNGGGVHGSLKLVRGTVRENVAVNGGGIAVMFATISQSLISDNTASGLGGGLWVAWAVKDGPYIDVESSTISGNSAATGGGYHQEQAFSGGPYTTINNSTIAGNKATAEGAGIYYAAYSGTEFRLGNTLLANNDGENCVDSMGGLESLGHNLSDDGYCIFTESGDLVKVDAKLGPLQDNGGPTLTYALLDGSPAIDAGDDTACTANDQRGTTRPRGAHCDIGAYEYIVNKPILKVSPASVSIVGVAGSTPPPDQTLHVTNDGTGDFSWTASESIPWLSLNTTSGGVPSDVMISFDTSDLGIGEYSGNITFEAPGALQSPFVVEVNLQMIDASLLLTNGDFEQGSTGWQESSAMSRAIIREGDNVPITSPHSGAWAAVLGEVDGENSDLSQSVLLPTGGDLFLYYYTYGRSTETNCTVEIAEVWIDDTKVKEHPLCTAKNSSQWEQQTIDLNAYRGNNVSLHFKLRNDPISDPSTFLVDDVSLSLDAKFPKLSSNFATGAPGSFFTLRAENFPANAEATISVNGRAIGTANTDGNGVLQVELDTAQADPGTYVVTVEVNPTATTTIRLAAGDPIRARTNSGTLMVVPSGIWASNSVFLPMLARR